MALHLLEMGNCAADSARSRVDEGKRGEGRRAGGLVESQGTRDLGVTALPETALPPPPLHWPPLTDLGPLGEDDFLSLPGTGCFTSKWSLAPTRSS